jgi:hypothetical protein
VRSYAPRKSSVLGPDLHAFLDHEIECIDRRRIFGHTQPARDRKTEPSDRMNELAQLINNDRFALSSRLDCCSCASY